MVEGEDFNLVYAPERVLQGKAISEIKDLPHIIGAYSQESFEKIGGFFDTFSEATRHYMKPVEAEIGKLITNMTRYVNFALANEFHMIADLHGANINKIIDACNDDYPRLQSARAWPQRRRPMPLQGRMVPDREGPVQRPDRYLLPHQRGDACARSSPSWRRTSASSRSPSSAWRSKPTPTTPATR